MFDFLIKNAQIADGTGKSFRHADLAVKNGKIAAVGNLSSCEALYCKNAEGSILCPGFIDIHTHSDWSLPLDTRQESQIRQGVTTQFAGLCGYSYAPLTEKTKSEIIQNKTVIPNWKSFSDYLARYRNNIPTNFAFFVGHGTLRILAMPKGDRKREATRQEISLMQKYLADCLEQGAIGLSTGLEYFPGKGASKKELLALLEVIHEYNALHACHIKNRDNYARSSFIEIMELAKISKSRLQISHINCKYGRADNTLKQVLAAADWFREEGTEIGMDIIPSIWNHSALTALLPLWALNLSVQELKNALNSKAMHEKLIQNDEPFMLLHVQGQWDKIFIFDIENHKEHIGKTIAELAEIFKLSPWQTVFKILSEEENPHSVMFAGKCFYEEDIEYAIQNPYCCVCSDSVSQAIDGPAKNLRITPDSFTWAERFIRTYVFEKKLLSLPEAIHKLTGLPAALARIEQRGEIKEGNYADLVLLNPDKLSDSATFSDFAKYPQGIELVTVNGHIVYEQNTRFEINPGSIISCCQK